jgi:CheY-like chemotaxis protein
VDDQIKGKKVLTVDDSGTIRNYLRRALGQRGAIVEGAENGHEALEKITAQRFDIVLLDLLLPDFDGLEVLRQIRS